MHKFNTHTATNNTGFWTAQDFGPNIEPDQATEEQGVVCDSWHSQLAKMATVSKAYENTYSVMHRTCLETTRGLLISLPCKQAVWFCVEIKFPKYSEGHQAWITGIAQEGNWTTRTIRKPQIISYTTKHESQDRGSMTCRVTCQVLLWLLQYTPHLWLSTCKTHYSDVRHTITNGWKSKVRA